MTALPPGQQANLSQEARRYLREIGAPDPDADTHTAGLIWMHALAVGYSPTYLAEHAAAIQGGWPRVPLPATLSALTHSAHLGTRVSELLDDAGARTDEVPARVGRLEVCTEGGGDYALRAGWGHRQRDQVVMPGRGRLTEREGTGLPAPLGDRVVDVWLNDGLAWAEVPLPVWEFRIGGYQVLKKWLSYREFGVLGRPLTLGEVHEATGIIRRLAALVLLRPTLDASYQRCRTDTWTWERGGGEAPPPRPQPPGHGGPEARDPTWTPARGEALRRVWELVAGGQIAIHGPVAVTLTPEAREAMRRLRELTQRPADAREQP